MFLKVARGRGGEDQEGEDGQGLHVVGRSVNVGMQEKNRPSKFQLPSPTCETADREEEREE